MPIISDKDICYGKPVIQGTRLWAGLIVSSAYEMGIQALADDIGLTREQIREAIDYCASERCLNNCILYCQDCKKRDKRGIEIWKLAQELRDAPSQG